MNDLPPPEIPKELLEEYRKTIPQKLQNIKELINQFKAKSTHQALEALRFSVHKLAGSAGTYGFAKVSQICKKWELDILDKLSHFPPPLEWGSSLEQQISEIEKAFYGKEK